MSVTVEITIKGTLDDTLLNFITEVLYLNDAVYSERIMAPYLYE